MIHRESLKLLQVLTLGLAACVVTGAANAEPLERPANWHDNISSAWKQAKELDRPILIYVASNSCTFCRKMEHGTLKNPEVARQVEARFVGVSINSSNQPNVARSLRIRAYPTTLVYAPDGKLITSMRGYVGPEEFHQKLKSIR